jgi:hypothetical protein
LRPQLPAKRGWLFGGNTVVRMGVLVLFVGLAFLAKYAIDHALLPPELRLAGVGLADIALFAGGFWLRGTSPEKLAYALTLQGAGVAVLYLAVFAAFRLYQFLPAGAAFAALGLVCAFAAVIAVAQNASVMAFIGFAGGFAAPILVSTGQGNHVGLFSYYLLLGAAIAALAWVKAWRALNLLGFFATFGVATVWGVLKYRSEHFATVQPFLIAFFLVYLVAALLYATRHALSARRAIDATLIFGTPIGPSGCRPPWCASTSTRPRGRRSIRRCILGRNDASQPWRLLAQTVVYRLGTPGDEATNPPVALHGERDPPAHRKHAWRRTGSSAVAGERRVRAGPAGVRRHGGRPFRARRGARQHGAGSPAPRGHRLHLG